MFVSLKYWRDVQVPVTWTISKHQYPVTPTSNMDDSLHKAMALESLLQELSFWEPSTPTRFKNGDNNCSIDSAAMDFNNNRNNHDRIQHTISSTRSSKPDSRNNSTTRHFDGKNQCQHDSSSHIDTQIDDSPHYTTNEIHIESDTDFLTSVQQRSMSDGIRPTAMTEEAPRPGSPSLAELQACCYWNKAIDPATGRTYYYDIRTRQTQWEKVMYTRGLYSLQMIIYLALLTTQDIFLCF
jgi:WW domain